ncbi:DUF6036 family nucleotidyltransferase [Sporosarcina sp. FA9]|uniref:DUF6036 family nucleotidyltransferase n=1 Tax=Sporosarcina sp. FA9 TaxID=3413030 RepID=UPI003F6559F3
MRTVNSNSNDVYRELAYLDYECSKANVTADLVLLGGSGLLVLLESLNDTFRPTLDVDINVLQSSNIDKFMSLLEGLNIDIVGGVMEAPPLEDFKNDKNKQKLDINFSSINIYVPGIELLACCKIFSTRSKDLEDLESSSLLDHCNKDTLWNMVEEYEENLLNPGNPNLNLHELKRIIKERAYNKNIGLK